MRNNQDELYRSCRALLLVAAALVLAVGGIGCRRKEPASGRGKEGESAAPSLPSLAEKRSTLRGSPELGTGFPIWAKVSQQQIQAAQRAGVPVAKEVDLGGGVTMKFVHIPPGSFMMGSEKGWTREKPVHRVNITRGFYMGIHEVTQAQWQAVMGNNPASFKGDHRPVDTVSWNDCQEFIRKLNGLGQGVFRLPTEAEWEYACRAATSTKHYWGDGSPDAYAWYSSNSGRQTHPVGQKRPNAFGLYDMSGNALEWCQSLYKSYPYRSDDGREDTVSAAYRMLRGGCGLHPQYYLRSAFRPYYAPTRRLKLVGFRVVWSPPEDRPTGGLGCPRGLSGEPSRLAGPSKACSRRRISWALER